jgi:SAM-dependent MidA family methyltransferase
VALKSVEHLHNCTYIPSQALCHTKAQAKLPNFDTCKSNHNADLSRLRLHGDPLKNPGEADLTSDVEADLTSDVEFEYLRKQCLEELSICYGPANQRDFLHGLAIQVG